LVPGKDAKDHQPDNDTDGGGGAADAPAQNPGKVVLDRGLLVSLLGDWVGPSACPDGHGVDFGHGILEHGRPLFVVWKRAATRHWVHVMMVMVYFDHFSAIGAAAVTNALLGFEWWLGYSFLWSRSRSWLHDIGRCGLRLCLGFFGPPLVVLLRLWRWGGSETFFYISVHLRLLLTNRERIRGFRYIWQKSAFFFIADHGTIFQDSQVLLTC